MKVGITAAAITHLQACSDGRRGSFLRRSCLLTAAAAAVAAQQRFKRARLKLLFITLKL
jgi:hypothetical protein